MDAYEKEIKEAHAIAKEKGWHEKPRVEKLCEACRDAKKIVDELSGTAAQKYIDHLRKYHCTCGKGE